MILFSLVSKAQNKHSNLHVDSLKNLALPVHMDSVINRKVEKINDIKSFDSVPKLDNKLKGSTSAVSQKNKDITDSIKNLPKKHTLKRIIGKTSGNVSIGYDYGLIPFAFTNNNPTGYYKAEGSMGFPVFNLPFTVNFFYTSLKNISGLNNYFRVSFDVNKFREQLNSKKPNIKKNYNDSIKKLEDKIRSEKGKIEYYGYIQQKLGQFNSEYSDLKNKYPDLLNDSVNLYSVVANDSSMNQFISDAQTQYSNQAKDSLNELARENNLQPVINLLYKYKELKDYYNLNNIDTAKYSSYITSGKENISEAEQKINEYKKYSRILSDTLSYFNGKKLSTLDKWNNMLSNTKKFEVGMCYPSYSTFLISGIAIRGINYEYENKKTYFAISAGKTINNLFYTNNLIDNTINKTRNPFNYFDFGNLESGRGIVSLKAGLGKVDGNHIHFGILYGIGRNNLFIDSIEGSSTSIKEQNYVVELDSRLNIKKSFLQVVYGKSILQSEAAGLLGISKGVSGLFNNNLRSNAVMTRISVPIEKIKNNFTFTFRLVDPFFKSYGIGYMRSDNIRYEFRSEQHLIKNRLKLGSYYRFEEDNILNLLSFKNKIQSLGFYANIRIKKNINLRLDHSPLVQKVEYNNIVIQRHSSISNVVFTLLPGNNKLKSSVNLMGSFYNLSNESVNNRFYTATIGLLSDFGKSVQNNVYAGWFFVAGNDSSNIGFGNSFIVNEDLNIKCGDKLTVTANGKLSKNDMIGLQTGYGLKLRVKIVKNISCEVSAQKVVVGDFYNAYSNEMIKKFPYFCSSKINISW